MDSQGFGLRLALGYYLSPHSRLKNRWLRLALGYYLSLHSGLKECAISPHPARVPTMTRESRDRLVAVCRAGHLGSCRASRLPVVTGTWNPITESR
jgi:hypothetical protein